MTQRYGIFGRAALLAPLGLLACAPGTPAPEALDGELGTASQAILDGEPAGDEFAAVGALVYFVPEFGVVDAFCSGTLVARKSIVTARHCTPVIDQAIEAGITPAFALGPDAFNPVEVIPITGYVNAPSAGDGEGLLLDGGRDVAVAYLESKPHTAKPIRLGRFEKKFLGTEFTIAGYGYYDFQGLYGQRFAGTAEARALKGRWYKLLFDGDYDAYLEWYFTDSSAAQPSEEEAKEWWKIYQLEKNFELLAGGLPGESIGCYGDSGGPLLLQDCDGKLTTYGVSFAVEGTFSTLCGLGGGYAVFNQTMLDFVKDNL